MARPPGYAAVSLNQVYDAWFKHGKLPEKPVVLTFDDGYRGDYVYARPVLRRLRWPGDLNLLVGNLGDELTDEMVERLIDDGWELDAHTISHLDLTTLSGARLRREVAGSRRILQQRFHQPVNFFCYPAGKFNATTIRAVRRPATSARRPSSRGRPLAAGCSSSTASAWTARTASAGSRRSSSRPACSYFRFFFFLHFFFVATRRSERFRLWLCFASCTSSSFSRRSRWVAPGCHGAGRRRSLGGATEFGRGLGVVIAKSAALLLVSSPRRERSGHAGDIERRSAIPELRAKAGHARIGVAS